MAEDELILVEVAYALPDEQAVIEVRVGAGTTVREAIVESRILERFSDIDLSENKVGVFGKHVSLDTVLRAGDRVEIYRPLIADPKESRRRRAAEERNP